MKNSLRIMIEKSLESERTCSPQIDFNIFLYARNYSDVMKQAHIKKIVVWFASGIIAASICIVPFISILLNKHGVETEYDPFDIDPMIQMERLCDHAFMFTKELQADVIEKDVKSLDVFSVSLK